MYTVELNLLPDGIPKYLHDPYSEKSTLLKGTFTEVLNAISDFQFDIHPHHPLFDEQIRPYLSLVRIRDKSNTIIFRGRIIDFSHVMNASGEISKSFIAECELAYFLDSQQAAKELADVTIKDFLLYVISLHNAHVEKFKKIDRLRLFGGIATEVPKTFAPHCSCSDASHTFHIQYGSTWDNIQTALLENHGGFLWLEYEDDSRILNYGMESGELTKTPIEVSVNMESMTSQYRPSQNFTRLIPLGKEFERYELGIDRLAEVGIFGVSDDPAAPLSTQYWINEVRYHRDASAVPAGHRLISPWTGQLLLELAKLNYINPCLCENETKRADEYIEAITPNSDLPDINSRWAYNIAVDELANSGMIGSPAYWKEEKNAKVVQLRWLIRLAHIALSINSPRRGSHNSPEEALKFLSKDLALIKSDDDDFWSSTTKPRPITPPHLPQKPIDPDGEDEDKEEEKPVITTPPDIDTEPEEPDDLEEEEEENDEEEEDVYGSGKGKIKRDVDFGEIDQSLSPWIGQLVIRLSGLNFRPEALDKIDDYRAELETPDYHIDRIELYEQALDSLSNSGVIHSPHYWKQAHLSENLNLRTLVRLCERMVDKNHPLKMSPTDAIYLLRKYHLITAEEELFWQSQINDAESEKVSEWIPELLSSLANLNFNDYLSLMDTFREILQPRNIPDINDEGAYCEAVDSLSNTGAIDSPEYWKEPDKRNNPAMRWLIRLADFLVDKDNPKSDFPKTRLTIKDVNDGKSWLPVSDSEEAPIVEGSVIFDTNDPLELKQLAKDWIAHNRKMTHSISINAVDLSLLDRKRFASFNVGNHYEISNPLLNVSRAAYPLVEKQLDLINPLQSTLTFGGRDMALSTTLSKIIQNEED